MTPFSLSVWWCPSPFWLFSFPPPSLPPSLPSPTRSVCPWVDRVRGEGGGGNHFHSRLRERGQVYECVFGKGEESPPPPPSLSPSHSVGRETKSTHERRGKGGWEPVSHPPNRRRYLPSLSSLCEVCTPFPPLRGTLESTGLHTRREEHAIREEKERDYGRSTGDTVDKWRIIEYSCSVKRARMMQEGESPSPIKKVR